MSSIYPNADTSASNHTGLGPTPKFNISDAEVGLAASTDIHQCHEADGNGEPAPLSENTELTSDLPTEVELKQPRPDRRALFREGLLRIEKLIHPIGSPKPIIGPLPDEEMPDLSNNIFWLADQRRKAEQLSMDASSAEGSASGDLSCRPPSPRLTPRTPPSESQRTPNPPHMPLVTREARLIIQLLRKFGPGGNPDETEYGALIGRSPARHDSCDCAEAKADKLGLAGKEVE